jgi:hypothetical protein
VLTVMGIMGFIGIGAMTMMVGAVACFDNTSVEAFTDTDAVLAMSAIVGDVREAKSITILDGGYRLRITFPERTDEGYYDRHTPDLTSQVDYYLSDNTGVMGVTGTYLWRSRGGGATEDLRDDVANLYFEMDTARSVRITVTTRNNASRGPRQTQLTQRVVYLRNY